MADIGCSMGKTAVQQQPASEPRPSNIQYPTPVTDNTGLKIYTFLAGYFHSAYFYSLLHGYCGKTKVDQGHW